MPAPDKQFLYKAFEVAACMKKAHEPVICSHMLGTMHARTFHPHTQTSDTAPQAFLYEFICPQEVS